MSSIFQGLLDSTGRIKTGVGPIVSYFRSLPLNAAEEVVVGTGPIVLFSQGIPRNAAGEVVGLRSAQASFYGPGATPYGPNGELEAAPAPEPINLYWQGVPYTAGGIYATTGVGGAPAIIVKDFTLTPATVSSASAGYRLSPAAGTLAPDLNFAGGTIDLVLATDFDHFSISTGTNALFPGGSGNLAVQFGPYVGPGRLIMAWDGFDRYAVIQSGIYNYMVSQIGLPTALRLSIAPVGTA